MSTEATEKQKSPPKPSLPPRPHPFIKLCMGAAQITLRQKGNNSVISGRCKWYRNGFLKLIEAVIQPPTQESQSVPWVLVEIQTISYIHPTVPSRDIPAE